MTQHPTPDDPPASERLHPRTKPVRHLPRINRSKPRSKRAWKLRNCRRKPW